MRARCQDCGQIQILPEDVNLQVCTNLYALSFYEFPCPGCGRKIRRPVDRQSVISLTEMGVTSHGWQVPLEALESHRGESLSYDDLLEFVLELGQTDFLADLAAAYQ